MYPRRFWRVMLKRINEKLHFLIMDSIKSSVLQTQIRIQDALRHLQDASRRLRDGSRPFQKVLLEDIIDNVFSNHVLLKNTLFAISETHPRRFKSPSKLVEMAYKRFKECKTHVSKMFPGAFKMLQD